MGAWAGTGRAASELEFLGASGRGRQWSTPQLASILVGPSAQYLSTSLVCRDHRLTMLLRESLATANCRTTMIAHISDSPAHYAETLGTVQLAARIHRLRRKKGKVSPSPPPRVLGSYALCSRAPD